MPWDLGAYSQSPAALHVTPTHSFDEGAQSAPVRHWTHEPPTQNGSAPEHADSETHCPETLHDAGPATSQRRSPVVQTRHVPAPSHLPPPLQAAPEATGWNPHAPSFEQAATRQSFALAGQSVPVRQATQWGAPPVGTQKGLGEAQEGSHEVAASAASGPASDASPALVTPAASDAPLASEPTPESEVAPDDPPEPSTAPVPPPPRIDPLEPVPVPPFDDVPELPVPPPEKTVASGPPLGSWSPPTWLAESLPPQRTSSIVPATASASVLEERRSTRESPLRSMMNALLPTPLVRSSTEEWTTTIRPHGSVGQSRATRVSQFLPHTFGARVGVWSGASVASYPRRRSGVRGTTRVPHPRAHPRQHLCKHRTL